MYFMSGNVLAAIMCYYTQLCKQNSLQFIFMNTPLFGYVPLGTWHSLSIPTTSRRTNRADFVSCGSLVNELGDYSGWLLF